TVPDCGVLETSDACANVAVGQSASISMYSSMPKKAGRYLDRLIVSMGWKSYSGMKWEGHMRMRRLYGLLVSLRPGAGESAPSSWECCLDEGASIQRTSPCSHSWITGNRMLLPGLRESLK